jgi:hypothetical protein
MNGPGPANQQQFALPANQYPQQNKKIKENMKDLNYFIKTLEKFSKNSNL